MPLHVGAPVRQVGERELARGAAARRARRGRARARARAPPAPRGSSPSAPTAAASSAVQVEPDRHGLAPATAPVVRHRARGVARAPREGQGSAGCGARRTSRYGRVAVALAEARARRRARCAAALAPRRAAGARIVFTNGCFDLLHPGPRALPRGRAGARRRAGRRPERRRLGAAAEGRRAPDPARSRSAPRCSPALAAVDHVVVFDEDTPLALIAALAPDVLVKGADWAAEDIVGRDEVASRAAAASSASTWCPGVSTTELIRRIRAALDRRVCQPAAMVAPCPLWRAL